jgi:heat-inducible transcriptional repressor
MLTERQLEILLAVVYEYIQTGDSVGSRTVSKRYLPGRSAATIRNEMSDLEEMGYLFQPHVSAGRIPTTRAYRLYLDSVLQRSRPAPRSVEGHSGLRDHRKDIEGALHYATDLLGRLTRCVGVAALAPISRSRLTRIDFVRVDTRNILALVVLEGGVVRHRIVPVPCDLSQDALDELARRVNLIVSGRSYEEVRRILAERLREELTEAEASCRAALEELDQILGGDDVRLFTGSAGRLLDLPDFQDLGRLRALFSILEEGEPLIRLVRDLPPEGGVQAILGEENPVPEMKDCSLVLASTEIRERRLVVGIVGPLRMDYEKTIATLEGVLADLTAREFPEAVPKEETT